MKESLYPLHDARKRFARAHERYYDEKRHFASMKKVRGYAHDLYVDDLHVWNERLRSERDPVARKALWYCKEIEIAEYEAVLCESEAQDAARLDDRDPVAASLYACADLWEQARQYRAELHALENPPPPPPPPRAKQEQTSAFKREDPFDACPARVRASYLLMGFDKPVRADAIKKRYRILAKKEHPDVNGHSKEAARRFIELQDAYETLLIFVKAREK